MPKNFADDGEGANALAQSYKDLKNEIAKVIVGQDEVVRLSLTAVFCHGHALLIGVPGLAKTLLVQTLSHSLDLQFKRIHLPPDLMPSAIVVSKTPDKEI